MEASAAFTRAHPRSRGENHVTGDAVHFAAGSSPLARGKLNSSLVVSCCQGLIPAHAGKTSSPTTLPLGPGAHPRSRGENLVADYAAIRAWGSSPLTRGKPTPCCRCYYARGLIPAHAGKTSLTVSRATTRRAHPRSRGENEIPSISPSRDWGSSPLTRGKRPRRGGCGLRARLIPAHAGKTATACTNATTWGAHPRSRGENAEPKRDPLGVTGSSPLTRGKLGQRLVSAFRPGLIPAHAGKTLYCWRGHGGWRAHPRSRGENIECRPECDAADGSSPLTRGKHDGQGAVVADGGLIPAHAGKTLSGPISASTVWAHPRSRGENAEGRRG